MLNDDEFATHRQELRRGTVVLACLLMLATPNYGYALLTALEKAGFGVDANTLYPLLRRLENRASSPANGTPTKRDRENFTGQPLRGLRSLLPSPPTGTNWAQPFKP